MSYFKSIVALTLAFGLVFASCSQQEPLAPSVEPNIEAPTNQQTGPTEVVSLSLEAGFAAKEEGSNLRALEGSTFYRGRLRPKVTNEEVKILVFLGSATTNQFTKQKLTFTYDKDTNSVHYRGNLTVPAGLLQAQDLKMFLVAANERRINDNTLTMQDVNSDVFKNKLFADNEELPIDVPYFSDWIEVSQYVDGNLLDVARTNVLLRPQGHIIKLELSSSISALREVAIQALQIESNAITENGSYTLPSSVGDIGQVPTFTPVLDNEQNKFRKIELPIAEEYLDNNTTRSIYLWVEQTPGASNHWTRTFAKLKLNKPILDHSFTGAWWDGVTGKLYPVYYTNSTFERTGSTMNMKVDNITIVSPTNRMAYTLASNRYDSNGYVPGPNLEPLKLGTKFGDRQFTDYSHYTWSWLVSKNYVGDNPTPIIFGDANTPELNSKTAEFYIPTLEEFTAILPIASELGSVFRYSIDNNSGNNQTVTERVKLGNRKVVAPIECESTYEFYPRKTKKERSEVVGIRFKGGSNHHKMLYRYRELLFDSNGSGCIQLQTIYLGEFFPEIQTPDDAVNFKTSYPGATDPFNQTPEERILVFNRNNWGRIRGNLYWINKIDGNTASYLEYDYLRGAITLKTIDINTQANQENVLLLMRDL